MVLIVLIWLCQPISMAVAKDINAGIYSPQGVSTQQTLDQDAQKLHPDEAITPPPAQLSLPAALSSASGESVTVSITLESGVYDIAAAAFALHFDATQLSFDPADLDEDGVADSIHFYLPPGVVHIVNYDTVESQVEILTYGMSLPLPIYKNGVIATVDLRVKESSTQAVTHLLLRDSSLGDPLGASVPLTLTDTILTIQPAEHLLFMPLVER